jgi:BirA family biotin operon repressor/biotin-[acetyl-CoA-carboxylase] ligase
VAPPDVLSEDGIRTALSHGHDDWLECLDVFATIDSTNDWLASQTPPAVGRIAVAVADYQSRGRGRRGRRWEIPPGHGLCLSVGRFLPVVPERIPALTLASGVAVAEGLERLGVDRVVLKWPNDLVLRDGKLGGILSEIVSHGVSGVHVVVGVGLNVTLPDGFEIPGGHPGWGRGPASIAEALAPPPLRDALAASLIESLQAAFDSFESDGLAGFVSRWRERDWLRGQQVTVGDGEGETAGVAAGIAGDGTLCVDTDAGRRHIVAGDILRCRPDAPKGTDA